MTNQNESERSRIDNLLQDGRITPDDHATLIKALERGHRLHFGASTEIVVNPFRKISTGAMMALGVLIALLASVVGSKLAIYFPGVLDFQVIGEGKRVYSVVELMVQNSINGLLVGAVFFLGSLFSRQRNLRFVDFIGSALFARAPYTIFLMVLAVLSPIVPDLLPRKEAAHPSLAVLALAVLAIGFLAWQMTLMFFALKESSGLKGKALWICYVAGIVIAEAASIAINVSILG
jgi:hypothetical protein